MLLYSTIALLLLGPLSALAARVPRDAAPTDVVPGQTYNGPSSVQFTSSSSGFDGPKITKFAMKAFEWTMARSSEEGARNLVLAAAAGKADQSWHGQYISDGKVKPVSKFVQSEAGKKQQKRVWEELSVILEKIQPGVTKNF